MSAPSSPPRGDPPPNEPFVGPQQPPQPMQFVKEVAEALKSAGAAIAIEENGTGQLTISEVNDLTGDEARACFVCHDHKNTIT